MIEEFNHFKDIASEKKVYSYHNHDELLEEIKKYQYAVIYRVDRVDVIKAADINNLDRFIELRAFDENEELHVIKVNPGVFKGRYRTDNTGKMGKVWDEAHLLWGNPRADQDGVYLSEDRGTKINLRFNLPGLSYSDQDKRRVFIKVRNYLNQNPEMFNFEDYRFVDFFVKEADDYGKKTQTKR